MAHEILCTCRCNPSFTDLVFHGPRPINWKGGQ